MKYFTIMKTGYTAGVYGCTNEYFTCVVADKDGIRSFKFHGMYGAEERVSRAVQDKGYKERYTQAEYGQLKKKDILTKNNYHEYAVIENIDELIKRGYLEN